jgi:hypothetical protein
VAQDIINRIMEWTIAPFVPLATSALQSNKLRLKLAVSVVTRLRKEVDSTVVRNAALEHIRMRSVRENVAIAVRGRIAVL